MKTLLFWTLLFTAKAQEAGPGTEQIAPANTISESAQSRQVVEEKANLPQQKNEVKVPSVSRPKIQTSKIIKSTEEEELPVSEEDIETQTAKIQNDLEKIKNIKPENFLREIDLFRSSFDRFIENKKRVCQGEFSTTVVTDTGTKKVMSRRKLRPEERKSCLKEMRDFQIDFVENVYTSRVRYIESIHEKRLDELSESKKKIIQELKNSFKQ